MNEQNVQMADLHKAVVDLQSKGLAPMKPTEPEVAEVVKRPGFLDVAKKMYESDNFGNFIGEKSLEFIKNRLDFVDAHPVASSILSVPVGVTTVLTTAFLFGR